MLDAKLLLLPPLLLRFILPFEVVVPILYQMKSSQPWGLGRNAERSFRHQLRVMP
jgi:hypothetical protein